MNPIRLLGALALFVGSASLLGEFFIGDDALKQATGFVWAPLRPSYGLTFMLGLLALWSDSSPS